MRPRPRITLLRLLAAVAATTPAFAAMSSAGEQEGGALAFGLVGAGATAGIVLLAPSFGRGLIALLAVASGVLCGLPYTGPCLHRCVCTCGPFDGTPIVGLGVGLLVALVLPKLARWYLRPFRS